VGFVILPVVFHLPTSTHSLSPSVINSMVPREILDQYVAEIRALRTKQAKNNA
jgi:hypothetical protein